VRRSREDSCSSVIRWRSQTRVNQRSLRDLASEIGATAVTALDADGAVCRTTARRRTMRRKRFTRRSPITDARGRRHSAPRGVTSRVSAPANHRCTRTATTSSRICWIFTGSAVWSGGRRIQHPQCAVGPRPVPSRQCDDACAGHLPMPAQFLRDLRAVHIGHADSNRIRRHPFADLTCRRASDRLKYSPPICGAIRRPNRTA
jgi:hypothetical protein